MWGFIGRGSPKGQWQSPGGGGSPDINSVAKTFVLANYRLREGTLPFVHIDDPTDTVLAATTGLGLCVLLPAQEPSATLRHSRLTDTMPGLSRTL